MISPLKKIRHLIEAAIFLCAWGVFRLLPLDVASWLGGRMLVTLGPYLRVNHIAQRNLELVFPEKDIAERMRILRAMWDHLGRVMAEFAHAAGRQLLSRTEISGTEHLPSPGVPSIFISGHLGNWELTYPIAHMQGIPVTLIYRHANNPWIDKMICAIRRHNCSEMIRKDGRAGAQMLASIRKNHALAMLIDQKMNNGIAVPFFGIQAMTAPAVAQFALRYEMPITPARVIRTGGAHFKSIIEPPMKLVATGDNAADTLRVMTEINSTLERWIRENPEQWFWIHRRFDKALYK